MKIIPFAELSAEAWDEVVEQSTEAWLFHQAEWVAIESRFFTRANCSFAVQDDRGAVAAVCPLYQRDLERGRWTERLLDSGHHRQAGPAFRDALPPSVRKAAVKVMMRHILEAGRRLDVDRIQLNAHNLAPAVYADRMAEIPFWVQDFGFRLGLSIGPNGDLALPGLSTVSADQIVELTDAEQEIFQRLDENFRKAVRKARQSGLTCQVADYEPIGDYYALAEISAQRTGEHLASPEYYRAIWSAFHPQGRCAVVFALYEGRKVGAIFLLLAKESASYLAGVSHHDYLPMRVNNFLHWEALRWARSQGCRRYRLGPVFPELPHGWPVSRVSRFKGEFGATARTIIQGSLFLKPERYLEDAREAVARTCQRPAAAPAPAAVDAEGLGIVLRRYGFFGLDAAQGTHSVCGTVSLTAWQVPAAGQEPAPTILLAAPGKALPWTGIEVLVEPGRQLLWTSAPRPWFKRRRPVFHALLPHVSFAGPGIRPIWVTSEGRAVLAWREGNDGRALLIGIPVVEEMVRHNQGDPSAVEGHGEKGRWGFPHERPNYLYEGQLHESYRTLPWADFLGFTLAELLAEMTELPLVEPLPHGAWGAVLLTGDDDEAYLEKYQHQLRCLGDFPITYFLLPRTRHTPLTLTQLPSTVELGLHVDSLDVPARYAERCLEQCRAVEQLCGRPVHAVRNHGFLSAGSHGHLPAWEQAGLTFDVNLPGLDGTVLGGSLLPFRVRRPDRSWSNHWTLLTAFGDGMLSIRKLSQRQAARRIRALGWQVEATRPGILVFNFHPQNIADTTLLHRTVVTLGRRNGWIALGAESYLRWLEARETLRMRRRPGQPVELIAACEITGLTIRRPLAGGWHLTVLPPWSGLRAVA
jgi:hypothetical protein